MKLDAPPNRPRYGPLQTRPVSSRSSSNQWPDWLIAEIVVAVVIAVIAILGLVACGWYWRNANSLILGPEDGYSAPAPKYNNLEGRSQNIARDTLL